MDGPQPRSAALRGSGWVKVVCCTGETCSKFEPAKFLFCDGTVGGVTAGDPNAGAGGAGIEEPGGATKAGCCAAGGGARALMSGAGRPALFEPVV